ncbi:hypothetical protein NQ317_018395 [Molorchus minor]|uniref:Uncharacterized protein n=1 Tax=Molorchus minor TaxID=1323400 RepID=A0ABQ9J7E7_9CUCU|nr:hypothetical protein NQ317_018395 [Molorchus minor]
MMTLKCGMLLAIRSNIGTDDDEYNLLFPQYDFILGMADFTGELMRRDTSMQGFEAIAIEEETCSWR